MFSRCIKLFFISDMTSLHTENCQIETEQNQIWLKISCTRVQLLTAVDKRKVKE